MKRNTINFYKRSTDIKGERRGIMNNNIIILKKNSNSIFFKYIEDKQIEKYYKINERNYLFRLSRKFKLPLFNLFLGKWTKNIKKYEKIIMFDNGFNEMIAKYVKKKNVNTKVVLWYWNPVTEYSEQFLKSIYIDEIWSYNKTDVKKYGLKYNTQFYTNKVVLSKCRIKDDIVFLGNAKNRKKDIIEIEKVFNEKNLKTNFRIIENRKDYIKYDLYLKIVEQSKCILDYNANQQDALTIRPMEALFLRKKLITNNKNIINYDFYKSSNIFVLGIDNINKIEEFINSSYEDVNQDIIEYYDFKKWLKRFKYNEI